MNRQNFEQIPEPENHVNEYPRVEQTMIRMAVNTLTDKQKAIWVLYNNDRLTQDEVAEKLGISRHTVEKQIRGIEKKIVKFCTLNRGEYMLMKLEQEIMGNDSE